jgi:hypothetical protein
MIPHFHILGSNTPRPSSNKTIFADGAADETFRPDLDMELSHWVPNRTPEIYKANTSTEICMNFIVQNTVAGWDLAINNHLDVDGLLSVFTLVHSDMARKHRDTIVQAAEMGDFWAYGDEKAQILFQGLTLLMNELHREKHDIRTIYERCFEAAIRLLENPTPQPGLEALSQSLRRIETGEIGRHVHAPHFVHYHIPRSLAEANLTKALHIPAFNAPIQDNMWLHPQARHQLDFEKVHLVSVETAEGHYYDLHYPGYIWADAPHAWRAPGITHSGSSNGYSFNHAPLTAAAEELTSRETAPGRWVLVEQLSPFSAVPGRNFPVILSFLDETGRPAPSHLLPAEVISLLAPIFTE